MISIVACDLRMICICYKLVTNLSIAIDKPINGRAFTIRQTIGQRKKRQA